MFPRAAALLHVSPISDVIAVISPDTFKRPIYAGSAIATVKSSDAFKIITVRQTAFAPAVVEGGESKLETVKFDGGGLLCMLTVIVLTKWVSEQIAKSDRPELGILSKKCNL